MAVWGVVTALAGPRCGPVPEDSEAPPSALASVRATGVRWRLGWDASRITRAPDGSWSVTTDLGYRVTVTSGALVTLGLTLHHCEASTRSGWSPRRWLGPSSAWANHGKELDPSAVRELLVEDLAALAPRSLAALSVSTRAYCEGHWVLSAPPLAREAELPVGLGRVTLTLQGSWSRGAASGPIALTSTLANGDVVALQSATLAPSFEGPIDATLTRSPGSLFDGITFESDGPAAQSWRVLENLVRGATLRVERSAR
ncbi:MAG: hypothetical protein HY909_15610 [Deltaproteobacteria bacterium]|nr:hypothetical protein [Deltaproteobacteria bacterium]